VLNAFDLAHHEHRPIVLWQRLDGAFDQRAQFSGKGLAFRVRPGDFNALVSFREAEATVQVAALVYVITITVSAGGVRYRRRPNGNGLSVCA
jgi:hypothetical protein